MPKSVLTRGRSWVARITVLAMVASLMALAIPAGAQVQDTSSACPEDEIPSAGFVDLGGLDATTVQAIDCLVFYGISQGTSATTFSPTLAVPRWQMALFLTRQAEVHGLTLGDGSPQGFTDIAGLPADVQLAINQLAQLGVTQGTSATTFSPFDLVSRWQMALFISRLVAGAGITLPDGSPQGYTDIVSLSAEAQTAINQVTQLGIAQGTSATTFVPFAATLRWHMALFLTRTLAADGITPVVTQPSFTDMPELVSVEEVSYDDGEEELVLLFTFDEDIDFVDETGNFRVYEADGTQHEADDADVGSPEVTVTFEDIDEDEYDALTTAAVAANAVEDEDGDANPEGRAPYKDTTITTSDGEIDGINLVGATHEDRNVSPAGSLFLFEYDDDAIDLGDVPGGTLWIVLEGWDGTGAEPGDQIVACDAIEDDDFDGGPTAIDWGDVNVDDDEIAVECPLALDDDDWARALDTDIEGLGIPQAADNDSIGTDGPDLISLTQVGDRRVEFRFDENLEFPFLLPGGCDDSDDCAGAELRFFIYDEDGNVAFPNDVGPDGRAIVTDSNRTVRVEFDGDDLAGFGDGDDDLDGDLEGGFVDFDLVFGFADFAVQERSGDNIPNAPDEVRVGGGTDVDFEAGVTSAPDLESVSDIEVSDTDIDGDASEWELTAIFDENLVEGDDAGGECRAENFRLYLEDGTAVEAIDCETDDDEATLTFDDDDVEDAVLFGVAYDAVNADDNNQLNPEDSAPTEFAG